MNKETRQKIKLDEAIGYLILLVLFLLGCCLSSGTGFFLSGVALSLFLVTSLFVKDEDVLGFVIFSITLFALIFVVVHFVYWVGG